MHAEDANPQLTLDVLLQRGHFWKIRNWIYLGLIVAGLILAGVASIMRGKARKAEIKANGVGNQLDSGSRPE